MSVGVWLKKTCDACKLEADLLARQQSVLASRTAQLKQTNIELARVNSALRASESRNQSLSAELALARQEIARLTALLSTHAGAPSNPIVDSRSTLDTEAKSGVAGATSDRSGAACVCDTADPAAVESVGPQSSNVAAYDAIDGNSRSAAPAGPLAPPATSAAENAEISTMSAGDAHPSSGYDTCDVTTYDGSDRVGNRVIVGRNVEIGGNIVIMSRGPSGYEDVAVTHPLLSPPNDAGKAPYDRDADVGVDSVPPVNVPSGYDPCDVPETTVVLPPINAEARSYSLYDPIDASPAPVRAVTHENHVVPPRAFNESAAPTAPPVSDSSQQQLRDWNEEFQRTFELPQRTAEQKLRRAAGMHRISRDFAADASSAAQVIVKELSVSRDLITIRPVDVGGIAGGGREDICCGSWVWQ
jgi:hypothetical protein